MTIETFAIRARSTRLGADEVASFEARAGQELLCTSGHLWITQDGDPRDVFVQPGQRFRFDRHGVAVIHALHSPGAFVLAGAPARRLRSSVSLASIAETLRAWFGKPARAMTFSGSPQRTSRGRLAQTLT